MPSETTTDITRLGAAELARQIAAGRLSAREVVEAHIARIEQVEPQINAVAIRCFDSARRAADEADAAQQRGAPLGPLHGVPVTIKECFFIQGTDACVGVERLRGQPSTVDSPLVVRLREAGAIVLGKTNVPQLMAMHETDNPVYGRTNNPWNLDRGPGGSSGGEAAIIAACGSPLGLGSDLGGSIRQPAHSCGIVGFKPTTGGPPLSGAEENFPGLLGLAIQPGPMARRVEDIVLAMRVLMTHEPPAVSELLSPPPIWREPGEVPLAQLRVAMVEDDGSFAPSPAMRRAVREAAAALRQQGIAVEPFVLPDVRQMIQLYLGILTADGGNSLKRILGGSRRDWRIRQMLRAMALPGWLRPPIAAALRGAGQTRLARAVAGCGARSADSYRQIGAQLRGYVRELRQQLEAGGFDAVLLPPHGLVALPHGGAPYAIPPSSYAFLGNVLNGPAGVVPATRVRPGEESDRPASRELMERGARRLEEGSAGMPVGVQVLAVPGRDAEVLALLQTLESHFEKQPDYPHLPPEI